MDLEKRARELELRLAKAEEAQKQADQRIAKGVNGTSYAPVGNRSDSLEQKALGAFRAKSVADLLHLNTAEARFKHVPFELKETVKQLKEDLDISRLIQQVCHGERCDSEAGEARVKGVLSNHYGRDVLASRLKAFGTGTATEGAEWVATITSSNYLEEFELERQVMKHFRTMDMPSNPWELPVSTTHTTARIQAESGSLAGASFNTSKMIFDATKLTEYYPISSELDEDSAPPILAIGRTQVVEAQGRAFETAILNGTKSGTTHIDSDTEAGAANLAEKAWNGLRKLAIDNSATVGGAGAAVTINLLRDLRALMGKYGVNVRDLVYIMPPSLYNQTLALPEVTTVDNFGPMATILKGSLASIFGIPIVVSEYLRDDLNASGVHDGVTETLSGLLLVESSRFIMGRRRPIKVRAVPNPTPPADEWLLASWSRMDFQGYPQGPDDISVAYGINVLP